MSRKARVQFSRARRSCRFQRKFSAVSAFSFFPFFLWYFFISMFARNPTSSRNFFFWGEGNVFQWKKKVFTSSPPPSEYEMRVGHFFFALFYFIFYFCLFGSPARARRFRFRRRNGANRNQFGERFLFFILFFFICFFSKKKNERKKTIQQPARHGSTPVVSAVIIF